ncbi:MAG: CBS domain-containing protein [Holosporales bacterium]|jgi:magnesium and cobalt transporter|nr:CBS domain-containing protein [Holosporales bacterium]
MKKFLQKLFFKILLKKTSLRDLIEELIKRNDSSKIQPLAQNETEMLKGVLNLRDVKVKDIMIPKNKIESLPTEEKFESLISKFVETKKSSIIIYQETINNVLGIVYLKDAVSWFYTDKPFSMSVVTKEVLFIPPAMNSYNLLLKMKESGVNTAVVVDEYGDVDGLVSLKDITGKIIGNIQAEIADTNVRIA